MFPDLSRLLRRRILRRVRNNRRLSRTASILPPHPPPRRTLHGLKRLSVRYGESIVNGTQATFFGSSFNVGCVNAEGEGDTIKYGT